MQKQSYQIEFFCVEHNVSKKRTSAFTRYAATVTIVSVNFQLFKVSDIKKVSDTDATYLSSGFFITSYPCRNGNEAKWKDASTFRSDKFIQVIGEAIEAVEREPFLV